MAVLEVFNVSKSFDRQGGSLEVMRNIEFEVGNGQIVTLVGPSGCGKSTLLRIVAGLEAEYSGRVVTGEHGQKNDKRAAMLFQSPTLLAWRTVVENVRLPLELKRMDRRDASDEWVSEVVRSVGLKGFENYFPAELSGGMQARASLARALGLRPPLILLDEPFANIDEISRFSLCDVLIRALRDYGTSAVLVTHSLDEAVLVSDRIIVLTPRPASIVGAVDIAMPKKARLREPEHPRLVAAKKDLRSLLRQQIVRGTA
jgi:NitT/TauT family transport system ATP-binding protein